jgi:hypothetical protein
VRLPRCSPSTPQASAPWWRSSAASPTRPLPMARPITPSTTSSDLFMNRHHYSGDLEPHQIPVVPPPIGEDEVLCVERWGVGERRMGEREARSHGEEDDRKGNTVYWSIFLSPNLCKKTPLYIKLYF